MSFKAIAASAALLLCAAASGSPQEGAAVSVARCRSDLANWTHHFTYVNTGTEEQLLPFDQLKERSDEAKGCSVLDSNEPYVSAAATIQTRYGALMRDRLYNFVARHNLTDQFQKEDANGLR